MSQTRVRLACLSLIACLAPTTVRGRSPANEPKLEETPARLTQRMIHARYKFIEKNYALEAQQTIDVSRLLMAEEAAQKQYFTDTEVTLRRLPICIAQTRHDDKQGLTDEMRKRLIDEFTRQYHDIQGKAPMSLAAIVRKFEATIPQQQKDAGRQRIRENYADRMKELGWSDLDMDRLDLLVAEPVPEVELPLVPRPKDASDAEPIASPAPEPAKPVVEPAPPVQPVAKKTPPPVTPPPARPTPLPPPTQSEGPKVFATTPPVEQWAGKVEEITRKYGYDAGKTAAADRILGQTRKRAETLLQEKADAIKEAEGIEDETQRNQKLGEIREPISNLYFQLIQRVESLASAEERNKAAKR